MFVLKNIFNYFASMVILHKYIEHVLIEKSLETLNLVI